jgi:3-oxoacyl-[acyl-carrier protein] reductase
VPASHSTLPGTIDLAGRRALVTGAARGIGAATAYALSELGAHIVGTDVLPLDDITARIEARGGTFESVRGDLTDDTFRESLLGLGPFFSVAHVAGVFQAPAELSDKARFDHVMDVNVRCAVRLASAAVDQMAEFGEGYVVLVGSLAGRSGGTLANDSLDYANYAASKGALHSAVRWLSRRAITHGVRVNGVAPGGVRTPLTENVTFDPDAFPLGRIGNPEEIGWPIALLATPAAGFVSGAILDVNGGVWVG